MVGGGDVGVGVQGEAYEEVTKHSVDRLDIHAVLRCYGCEGVAKVVNSDFRDAGSDEDTLEHIVHAIR